MVDETLAPGDAADRSDGGAAGQIDGDKMKVLENIEVNMSIEVGRTDISIRDLLRLNEGSVVELDRLAGEPLDILVNGTMIAKGEVVMVGERFGIRFSEIVDPEKRMETI
jgi:flagellar motor switch protein FliN/FliY|tara:strand:- start:107 stop:436 length:330 start_codon:yes stop_codon:yes gene_type:complete